MNIFQKIGNKIEKNKKKKIESENKYWKLSAIERIDYDKKLKEIKDNIPCFYITLGFFKLIFYIGLFFIMLYLLFDEYSLIESAKKLVSILIKYSWIPMLVDFLELIFDKSDKKLKELNKRFKL